MGGGGKQFNPHLVQRVFSDFSGRRDALIKALTTDFAEFFKQCDPGNLCLFGLPSGNWEVNVPAEQVPTDFPEPALGINFARDKMQEQDWVALVAVSSDAWLVSVAHYVGTILGFGPLERIQLFNQISGLSTVFETVFDTRRNQGKENASISISSGNKSKSASEGQSQPVWKKTKIIDDIAAAGGGGEDDVVLCGCCGEKYTSDEFWMCCHFCEKSYHGTCVKITPARAEHIKRFECPSCYRKNQSQP